MIAPKALATSCAARTWRARHPALMAIQRDATGRAVERTLAYARAWARPRGRAGDQFKDETETTCSASRASCAAASAR